VTEIPLPSDGQGSRVHKISDHKIHERFALERNAPESVGTLFLSVGIYTGTASH